MSDSKSLRRRFARRAIIGATIVGAALGAQVAQAAVVTHDFSNDPLSVVPFNLGGVYVNVVTGAASTDDTAVPGWDINPFFFGLPGLPPGQFDLAPNTPGGIVVGPITPWTPAASLAIGQTISPQMEVGFQYANAGIYGVGDHYFGFTFLNEATDAIDIGYIEIKQSTDSVTDGGFKIVGWAYDDAGGALTVSQLSAVPEPATYAMFGAGLLAFAAMQARRRRAR